MGYTGLKGLPPTPNPREAVQRNAMELLLSPSGTVGKTAEAGGQVPHCRFTKLSAKEDPTGGCIALSFSALPPHPPQHSVPPIVGLLGHKVVASSRKRADELGCPEPGPGQVTMTRTPFSSSSHPSLLCFDFISTDQAVWEVRRQEHNGGLRRRKAGDSRAESYVADRPRMWQGVCSAFPGLPTLLNCPCSQQDRVFVTDFLER